MGIALVISAVAIILSICYFWIQKRFLFWRNRGVPYVEPSFPFGNLQGIGTTKHTHQLFQELYKELNGRDTIGGMFFFCRPAVIVLDPDLVKLILVKDFNFFHDRGVYYNEKSDPLSGHLFSLDGQKWRTLRSKLSPTFSSGKMKLMFNIIHSVTEDFKTVMDELITSDKDLEIKDILSRYTIDIIGSCAFGIDCNSMRNPEVEFMKMGKKIFEADKLQQLKEFFVSTFQGISKKLGLRIVRPDVSEFFLKLVQDTVEYREKNNIVRNDFMNLLLQLKNQGRLLDEDGQELGKISLNELAAQSFVFFLAGYETSASTMTFCLYELALNLDIQEKLRQEIRSALDEGNGELTYETVMGISYLDKVINETLRKYPPIDLLIRSTLKDYKIPNSKMEHIIPKDTFVMLPVYAYHHDPKYYPDPEKFEPERFSEETINNRHSYTYLPFGDGPRNCIGMRFGLMQTRIGIITILMNYKVRPCQNTKIPLEFMSESIILAPKNGLWLNVEKLNRS